MSDPNKPADPAAPVTGQGEVSQVDSIAQEERKLELAKEYAESRTLSNKQLLEQAKLLEEINNKLMQGYDAQQQRFTKLQLGLSEFSEKYKAAVAAGGDASKKVIEDFEKTFQGSDKIKQKIIELTNAADGPDYEGIEKLKGDLKIADNNAAKFNKGITNLTGKLGGAAKFSDTFAGSITSQIVAYRKLDIEAKAEQTAAMKKSAMQAVAGFNVMEMSIKKLAKMAIEAFDAMNVLTNTFGTDQFSGNVSTAFAANAKFGASLADSGKLMKALGSEFSEFNFLSEDMIAGVSTNALSLERLGVSATTSGKALNPLVKGLGMTTKAASDLQVSIAASAAGFGKSSQQMSADFVTAMDKIIYAGEGAVQIFRDIQAESARTGIATSKLLGITDSYDKFSTAAQKAAELNALFGTSLSAMGMHTMDEGQRLEELKRQFQATGMSADSLNKYQLKALASNLGMTMPEALQYLGGELSANQKEQMEMKKASEELSLAMAKMTTMALPLVKQLEAMFNEIFSNKPTVDALIDSIRGIAGVMLFLTTHMQGTINTFILVYGAMKAYVIMAPLVTAGTMSIGMAVGVALGSLGALLIIFNFLYYALHKKGSPEFYLLFGVVALGILAIGLAAQVSQPGLYALAFVFAAVGFAALGIFYGMKMVIDAFTNMIVKTAEFADVIPIITLSVLGLAAGLYLLGASGAAGMVGMAMAAVGLFAILAAFTLTGQSVGDFISGGGDEISKIGDGIASFGTGMEKLMTAAGKIKSVLGDGIMAASMEGDKMSLVVGKGSAVATLFKNDTLNIKVDMPKIEMPTPEFKIFIDGKEIRAMIEDRSNRVTQ